MPVYKTVFLKSFSKKQRGRISLSIFCSANGSNITIVNQVCHFLKEGYLKLREQPL